MPVLIEAWAWFAHVRGTHMSTGIHAFTMARRSYDVAFMKLNAIAAAERGNKQVAARQFKIDAKLAATNAGERARH